MATKIVTKNSSTASAVPTASDLVQGELAVNVADKRLFTEDNAGAIVELGTNPSTIDINAGTIDGTAIGASSASTGAFTTLTATGIDVTGTATMDGLVSAGTAFVNLTSRPAGVPATAGALWSAQTETGNYGIVSKASSTDSFTYIGNTGSAATLGTSYGSSGSYLPLDLQTSDKKRLSIAANGAISFYEDTGTTPKLFWDASAESLGIGTSSPDTQLTLYKASTNADVDYAKIRMDSWGGSTGKLKSIVWDDAGSSVAGIGAEYDGGKTNIHFHSQYNGGFKGTADRTMSIMGNGNVGIGTSSPTSYYTGADNLVVYQASGEAGITIATASDTNGALYFADGTSGDAEYRGGIAYNHSTDVLSLVSGGANRAYIDSSGNVGIGIAPIPDSAGYSGGTLHIHQPSTAASKGASLRLTNATNGSTAGTDGFYISQWEDTNTYFVNQEGSQLFYTGGSERMRIDSSGNVGIGTSSLTGGNTILNLSRTGSGVGCNMQFANSHNGAFYVGLAGNTSGDAILHSADGTAGMAFGTGNTERMRIDSSGNLLVGTTTAINAASGRGNIAINGSSSSILNFGVSGAAKSYLFQNAGNFIISNLAAAGGYLGFENNGAERMRIDASGNVGIGTTPASGVRLDIRSNAAATLGDFRNASSTGFGLYVAAGDTDSQYAFRAADYQNNALATITGAGNLLVGTSSTADTDVGGKIFSDGRMVQGLAGTGLVDMHDFYRGTAGSLTRVGNIRTNGSSTTYNTSSDYRLKENIADANDAGSKVDAIQVRKFDWKADGSHQDYGMIAQELQSVAPEAVSGDADSEEMMGVDYSKLVPMLVKEIQSLRNRVAQLEE